MNKKITPIQIADITVVLGVIGFDVHVVGYRILQFALESHGIQVVPLGVLVSQEEFIEAAIETGAHAILVSSLYGHAQIDAAGLRDKCNEADLENILLYIGGNLSIHDESYEEIQARFLSMGFDRVASPDTSPEDVIRWLIEDISKNRENFSHGA